MENLQHQTDYNDKLRNLRGTFAVEGITISAETINNIERLENGQASFQQILDELKEEYRK